MADRQQPTDARRVARGPALGWTSHDLDRLTSAAEMQAGVSSARAAWHRHADAVFRDLVDAELDEPTS